ETMEKRPRQPGDLRVGNEEVAVDGIAQGTERPPPASAAGEGGASTGLSGSAAQAFCEAGLQALELPRRRPGDADAARHFRGQPPVAPCPVRVAHRVDDGLPAEVAQVLGELERTQRAASTLGREAIGDHHDRAENAAHGVWRSSVAAEVRALLI